MDDFYSHNTSLDESYNHTNITTYKYNYNSNITSYKYNYNSNITFDYYDHGFCRHIFTINYAVTCTIICISLPLTLVAIYALYSLVQKDHVTPIYVINLLISDILQLCSMIIEVTRPRGWTLCDALYYIYFCGLTSSVGFMVCVAMERYLVVAWPLWYHFRRTIKSSVVVCVVVWALAPLYFLIIPWWIFFSITDTLFAVFLLLPLPLFIFFLGGTLRALSASQVPSDEKRRIVGCLVLVLLIYTLLFLPASIFLMRQEYNSTLHSLSFTFLKLSPLADLGLYVFMRKGAIDKLLASVCCCRMDSNEISSSAV